MRGVNKTIRSRFSWRAFFFFFFSFYELRILMLCLSEVQLWKGLLRHGSKHWLVCYYITLWTCKHIYQWVFDPWITRSEFTSAGQERSEGEEGGTLIFFFFCPGCSQLMLGAWANWATMTPFNWIYEFCGLTWIFTSYNFQLCRASPPQLHELLIGNTYAEYDGKRHKISNCKIKAHL